MVLSVTEVLEGARNRCSRPQYARLYRGCTELDTDADLVGAEVSGARLVFTIRSVSLVDVTYTVTVCIHNPKLGCRPPTCTCPDTAEAGVLCKHICFVLVQLLHVRAPWDIFRDHGIVRRRDLDFGFQYLPRRDRRSSPRNAGDACAICFDGCIAMDDRPLIHCTVCTNAVHWECALRWFVVGHNRTCPLCRAVPRRGAPVPPDDGCVLRDITNTGGNGTGGNGTGGSGTVPSRRLPASFYNTRPGRRNISEPY